MSSGNRGTAMVWFTLMSIGPATILLLWTSLRWDADPGVLEVWLVFLSLPTSAFLVPWLARRLLPERLILGGRRRRRRQSADGWGD